MKKFTINEEISEKLRGFLKLRFTKRGKFKELESASGISSGKWENFFYRKQEATQEIIKFWTENYSDDQLYSEGVSEYDEGLQVNKSVSHNLRQLIVNTFKNRGRFNELENKSGISATSWKNFYYERQGATKEMVGFWLNFQPESADLILRGDDSSISSDIILRGNNSPITSAPLTLAERLNWVIQVYCPNDADHLFEYLSKRSKGNISADAWQKVIHKTIEPTLEMVIVICQMMPYYTEWIIRGYVNSMPQVDPTNKRTLDEFNKRLTNMVPHTKNKEDPAD